MRRRHRLDADRTASYPLLIVRKPAPTVAGDPWPCRGATSDAPDVSLCGYGGAGWKHTTLAHTLPPSLASLGEVFPRLRAWHERSPPPIARRTRWCPTVVLHRVLRVVYIVVTPMQCDYISLLSGVASGRIWNRYLGTYRNNHVRWEPASAGPRGRRGVSPATLQRGALALPQRLRRAQ